MLLGDIRHWEKEKHLFPAAVQRGVDFIQSMDVDAMEAGKYPIEGDLMFAMIQEMNTEPRERRRPESHAKYTDIQYLVSGRELIGVLRHPGEIKVTEDRLEADDVAFYEHDEPESELVLQPGMFAVFFPADIHRPCCSADTSGPIRKVVVKIHEQLLRGE